MSQENRPYNPYTDGRGSGLNKAVTALMVIFAVVLAGWYAHQGYNNARQNCLAQNAPELGVHADFSLRWTPPFTTCTVSVPTQSA